jgi:lysozyme
MTLEEQLIKHHEGLKELLPDGRIKAYLCPAHIPTIGYGTTVYKTGKKVQLGDIITKEQAESELQYFLSNTRKFIDRLIKVILNEGQRASLYSFAYNVGIPNFGDSTLLKKINANPSDPTIEAEFMRWTKSKIKQADGSFKAEDLPGLVKRRKDEAYCYLHSAINFHV